MRPLEPALVTWLMRLRDRRFPIVVDEIQSGMGRTGTFLASEGTGLIGDYYCLGKSLGGGLVKIAATMVARSRYDNHYSTLHTSTFAEDDLSSRLSLRALALLDEEHGLERARNKGELLLDQLEELRRRFPSVLKEVRGRGLMVGVELHSQTDSSSPVLRLMDQERYLGYAVAAHLLNRFDIRIFPTLSSPRTLRLEPSYRVPRRELERFVSALAEVCNLLARGDAGALLAPLVEGPPGAPRPAVQPAPLPSGAVSVAPAGRPRVAFLGHFLQATDLKARDPSLALLSDQQLVRLYQKTHTLFERGVPLESEIVRSPVGSEVELRFIGHYLTADTIYQAMRARDDRWIRRQITASVQWAKAHGCSLVGFGGYTSIVAGNCRDVPVGGIGLTSGNSLTVAMALEAVRVAGSRAGLDLSRATVGVVGASGNIGTTCAEILAPVCGSLSLFGRPLGRQRLRELAARILRDLAGSSPASGGALLEAVHRCPDLVTAARDLDEEAFGRLADERLLDDPRVQPLLAASSDLSGLRRCSVIIASSNSPTPVLTESHVAEGQPVIVCDIAVPRDTSPSLLSTRPQARIIKGGLVSLPCNERFQVAGIPLKRGQSYACMAETLLLGLEGWKGHFSYGPITGQQVAHMQALARKHDFRLMEEHALH